MAFLSHGSAWVRAWAILACALGPLSAGHGATPDVRVVSQTVGSDELLLALAEPAQIAALSHIARDPDFSAVAAEAAAYPQIAMGDAETILRFHPTLVLFADYSRPEIVAQVQRAGVRVVIFDHYDSLDDAYANLRTLARDLGAETKAEAVIAACETRVAELRRRLSAVAPLRVLAPSTYGLIPGRDTTFQDLCDHAAAENIAATLGNLRGHVPPPSEKLLTWPIDRIVLAGRDRDAAIAVFAKLSPYQFLPALRERRVVLLEPYMLSCVSHRRIDGYEMLARALHPAAFTDGQ